MLIGEDRRSFKFSVKIAIGKFAARTWTAIKAAMTLAGAPVLLHTNSLAAPNLVQGNYAVPQSAQTSVTVPYTATQLAGNLNVVIIGWSDTTAQISSVADSSGNVYFLAAGPTAVSGTATQSIFYSKNIAAAPAGANAVTVTFATGAAYPDVRVFEYSGIDPNNPVDGSAGAIGNSATSSSGPVTTTNSGDLLVAANYVQNATTRPGGGFTQEQLTEPDSDITEDRLATAPGSYTATATLSGPSWWIMQMVAFRAGGNTAATPTPAPAPATAAYVQGNYSVPQTPQTSVTVPYTAAQRAGDLNVVIVGWNDTTAQIASVTDTMRQPYQLAVGPTQLNGSVSQAIFYATGIVGAAAGANAVTVTFNTTANFPDVRILEYSGIDSNIPVDRSAAATGNSATSSSGALTTTNATDLLLAANCVRAWTAGPSNGFTQRLLTEPDGDIAEDAVTTASGSFNAATILASAGPWVMQMVAFREAGSPGPTSTPDPSPTPPPSPATSATLAWDADPATSDPGTNPVGYHLHYGTGSGNYTQTMDAGNQTSATVSNLKSGSTYYFAVTAYNNAGVDGPYSNEVSYTVP